MITLSVVVFLLILLIRKLFISATSKVCNRKIMYFSPSGYVHRIYADMAKQPHLLIAGATGSGKSVVINGIISTLLYHLPVDKIDGAQFILIDPKRVELSMYRNMPHTIKYASEPIDMLNALKYAMDITEARYRKMQARGERKYSGGDVYIIIDEFADLMTTQRKAVQLLIQRLAQIGRAAKVHIILATQTPISKIIPTEIKCNFDSRVGLRTRSNQDSRNILGFSGLENLPRYGQGYYMTPETCGYTKIPFVSDNEINSLLNWWNDPEHKKPVAA